MVRHGNLLLRPIPEPKKVLAAAEVAAFTLTTGEATHTLTGTQSPGGGFRANRFAKECASTSPVNRGCTSMWCRRVGVTSALITADSEEMCAQHLLSCGPPDRRLH